MLLKDHARDITRSALSLRQESAKRMLADIRHLAPSIRARAAEFESARRIPIDLVDTLRDLGVFRMFVPSSHGGMELDLPTGTEIITALAKIDGSFGWTAMIGTGASLFPATLPRETFDMLYRNGPDVAIAGSIAPVGTAERVAGGWCVNGRWPFASGCLHADWMGAVCVMTEGGNPIAGSAGANGPPMMRGLMMPASKWQIEDTWHVAGLKGTGSHHIAMHDQVVPDAHFFDFMAGESCMPGPLYQALTSTLPLLHGSFDVGMAEAALDELVAMANTGRQQLRAATPMRESEIFQYELGRVSADVRAARATHRAQVAAHWQHALAGTLRTNERAAESQQTGVWLATTCARAINDCFTLGGGSALYETSPLQRRMRDMRVAAQHATVQQRNYVSAGKQLLDAA
jgi:alkylation response protein AidB-like acyl-CoA dehydrogenase